MAHDVFAEDPEAPLISVNGQNRKTLLPLWVERLILCGCLRRRRRVLHNGNSHPQAGDIALSSNAQSRMLPPPPLPPPSSDEEEDEMPEEFGEEYAQRVAWVSLDPIRARLDVYPSGVAEAIEQAFQQATRSLQLDYFNATVHFNRNGLGGHIQQTATGIRDVRRLHPRAEDGRVSVFIHRPGRAWRTTDISDEECSVHPGEHAIEDMEDEGPSLTEAAVNTTETGGESWVAWISVDPRRPALDVYPGELAAEIEAAWQRGEATLDLGATIPGAMLHFQEQPFQQTSRGRRDCRRVQLEFPGADASLHVVRRGTWKAVEADELGAELLHIAVSVEDVVQVACETAEDVSEDVSNLRGHDCDLQPLWEWCHIIGQYPQGSAELPPECWGVYSGANNDMIEKAFQAGQSRAEITVGVREYHIVFTDGGFAKQVDPSLHKSRLVRRRLVSDVALDAFLNPVVGAVARDEQTCSICCQKFNDTPTMPILELPGCRQLQDEQAICIDKAAV
jgi:hypothetical protein